MTENVSIAVGCPTERAIIRALLYFEVFAYPLNAEEVFRYIDQANATQEEVQEKLDRLVLQEKVFFFEGFYQTQNSPEWISKRKARNLRADRMLPVAHRMARFIGAFPFVRAVFVSGSLSKHSMNEDSDIDFFLIMEPGRLWLARTLLVLFKKIFLFNSHKYFCVNYFIDTEHLEIEEKNLFTATEIVTLIPMYGSEWYQAFYQANKWAWAQYPNFEPRPVHAVAMHKRTGLKKILEWIQRGKTGDWLDRQSLRVTLAFWRKKFRYLPNDQFDLALKSRRYVSKHHPLHFQDKVLKAFDKRAAEMKTLV